MSVIIFDDYLSKGADMTRTGVYTGLFDNAANNVSAFGFEISMTVGGDQAVFSFTGENLTYTMSGDTITGITGGTITGVSEFINTLSVYGVGSLSYDGGVFFSAVTSGNKAAQLALLTGGDDVILGNYAREGDTLFGRAGKDSISGNGGDDTLIGGLGGDTLHGGSGDDWLSGGKNRDFLSGGNGADSFVFDWTPPKKNSDVVRDFVSGQDHVLLSHSIFSAIEATGPLAANAFHVGTAAADADDRVIFDAGSGALWYDADGDGAGSMRLIARFTGGASVDHTDILVF